MHAILVLQLCFLQCRWKTFAVLSSCPTGKDVVLKQILEQLFTSEQVIEEHMVFFFFEKTCEVLHHSLPKLLPLFSSVHLQGMEVAVVAVSKYSYLYSLCVRTCVCVGVYVYVCPCVHMCACMCVCACICMHACV